MSNPANKYGSPTGCLQKTASAPCWPLCCRWMLLLSASGSGGSDHSSTLIQRKVSASEVMAEPKRCVLNLAQRLYAIRVRICRTCERLQQWAGLKRLEGAGIQGESSLKQDIKLYLDLKEVAEQPNAPNARTRGRIDGIKIKDLRQRLAAVLQRPGSGARIRHSMLIKKFCIRSRIKAKRMKDGERGVLKPA